MSKLFSKNSKNRIIMLFILVLVLASIAIFLFFLLKKQEKAHIDVPVTFSSASGNLSLSVPSTFKFSEIANDSYDLVLKSEISGSTIYCSQTSATVIRDKQKFIEYDKDDYISKFPNISEVSEISTDTIHGLETYNYHFKYKDTMYVDVYWILKDSTFYIIDFNINTSSNDLTPRIEEILNSLELN